jgi:hypothetical protein
MPSTLNFSHADAIVSNLNSLVSPALNPLIAAQYAGFVTVAAVCVYEMAVKEIFMNFADLKHPILGSMTRETFERINGRVIYKTIKDEYVPKFGSKYSTKFAAQISRNSKNFLRLNGRDIISAYNNIITWRNEFVHAGQIPATATYAEVVRSYEDGKEVIKCLNEAMHR